jgi:hypothetical protein
VLLLAAGCAPPPDGEAPAVLARAAIASNAIASNAIASNAIASNAIASNAIASNALATSTLFSLLGPMAGLDPQPEIVTALEDDNARIFMAYLVSCALEPTQSRSGCPNLPRRSVWSGSPPASSLATTPSG